MGLFLRYLDEIEKENAEEAILSGDNYEFLIKDEFQWSSWAMPKGQDGKVDHHVALTGPDLVDFVDQNFFLIYPILNTRLTIHKHLSTKLVRSFLSSKTKFKVVTI